MPASRTLLFDLLTPEEEALDIHTREHRFNISLLAERLVHATKWARQQEETRDLHIGYFGSSTGGAAALVAAAEIPQDIGAVVSRGGRPDLAGDALPRVQAPTLLIVGGNDDVVIELNEMARDQMRCEVKLEIIPGATHLFEEPGALEQVAKLASDWFSLHLSANDEFVGRLCQRRGVRQFAECGLVWAPSGIAGSRRDAWRARGAVSESQNALQLSVVGASSFRVKSSDL